MSSRSKYGRTVSIESQISQFEAHYPIGSKARLAFALLLYTAQRRSDVVRMGRKHVRGDVVDVRQQKTGKLMPIPLHAELARIIAATLTAITPTFLMTAYGKPFTAAGFGGWFRERCDEAGLPKECTGHGLRKAACRRLAEAGCSNVIAAISVTRRCAKWSAIRGRPIRNGWRGSAWRR